jgi:hypothetical protein
VAAGYARLREDDLKPWIISLALGLTATSLVLAQTPPAAQGQGGGGGGGGGQAARGLRPPNIPNARGTDSGNGFPCDQLTTYGMAQPQGPGGTAYGLDGHLTGPAPVPAMPNYVAPTAPAATSNLGAGGMSTRGTVIPKAPKIAVRFVDPPQPPKGSPAFANVNGVGLLKNGKLIVTQRMPMFQTLEYTADNRLVRSINPNMIGRPHGMRIDAADNIWITDQQCNTVVKMNLMGEVLMTIGKAGVAGTWNEAKGDHLLNQPTDIAFAANGDVYVSTGHGGPDPRVLRFDKTGKYITSWSMAHAEGPAPTIHTLVVRKNGEVYVGDREAKKIRVFDASGKLLREMPEDDLICGLYVDSKDQLWMTTGMDGMVLKLGWDGKVLGYFGQSGFGRNDFGEAHYMTMTPDGKTMYVSDTVNNDIKKIILE